MTESFRTEELFFMMKKIGLDWTVQLKTRLHCENITGVQIYFLVYLLRHHPEGTYISELCRETGMAKSTLSELVKKLKNKGYLKFEKNQDDVRKKKVVPTERLQEEQYRILRAADQTETEIVSVLNPREQFQMWQLEQKLLAQLARMEDSEKKEVSLP